MGFLRVQKKMIPVRYNEQKFSIPFERLRAGGAVVESELSDLEPFEVNR